MPGMISKQDKKEFVADLNFLFGVFDSLHTQFYVWRFIYDKKYHDKRKINDHIFHIIFKSMQDQILIHLSKIVCCDKDSLDLRKFSNKYRKDSSSEEIDKFLINNIKFINKLKIWRDKYLAHFDNQFVSKQVSPEKDYPIKMGELEKIIIEVSDLIEKIAKNNLYDPSLLDMFFMGQRNRFQEKVDAFFKTRFK